MTNIFKNDRFSVPQLNAVNAYRDHLSKQTHFESDSGFIVPPLNTAINFVHNTQSYSDQDHLELHLSVGNAPLPETFSWRFDKFDSSELSKKKKLIMPPDNQYLCGSCWAISTASVIGDAFVVAGLVDWSPQISTTWALMCYPEGKCQGGSPATLLQDIARGTGIPSKHCVDYSWCAENESCKGMATRHFDAKDLSSLIPTECACFYGGKDTQHYNYTINNDVKTLAIGHGATSARNIQDAIKKHILVRGPALTGFFVLQNFTSGYFTKVKMTKGVYLERCDYKPGQLSFSDSNASGLAYRGSHAVAIIGWGVAKDIVYDIDRTGKEYRADVPFWYCRNSWGNWGYDGGYFKMAMYPWNKLSQFGKIVDIVDSSGNKHYCGGIITFSVSVPPTLKIFNSLRSKLPQYIQNIEYYKKSEQHVKKSERHFKQPSKWDNILELFVLVFLVIIVIFCIRLQ
jgi:hypothetical protein